MRPMLLVKRAPRPARISWGPGGRGCGSQQVCQTKGLRQADGMAFIRMCGCASSPSSSLPFPEFSVYIVGMGLLPGARTQILSSFFLLAIRPRNRCRADRCRADRCGARGPASLGPTIWQDSAACCRASQHADCSLHPLHPAASRSTAASSAPAATDTAAAATEAAAAWGADFQALAAAGWRRAGGGAAECAA